LFACRGVFSYHAENCAYVVEFAEFDEEGGEFEQFPVVGVVKPTFDGYRVFWLQTVADRGIVDNQTLFHATSDRAQIFDETAVVIHTCIPL